MDKRRIEPGPGQESVWDYPRPPRLEATGAHVEVRCGGLLIADTRRAFRVLETSHPPGYYLDPADIQIEFLRPSARTTTCEWKGAGRYYDVVVGDTIREAAAWHYPNPTGAFSEIAGFVSFYPQLMDACFVNGEEVQPQVGQFYGGWITSDVVGPFKGASGTWGW